MTLQQRLLRQLPRLSTIGADPSDSDELRLQKTLLVGIAFMIAVAAIIWGALYYAIGEPLAAAFPLSYSLVASLNILVFSLTRRYHFFRFSQLFLILVLPFLLMMTLGGFVTSSAVILWSLLCPLGALLFADLRQARWWFAGFLGLVILSGLLQPYVRAPNALTPELILMFFVMNITAISTIIFIVTFYFVGQKERFLGLLRREQEKSERLLLNVLPREIAAILKDDDRTIAEHHAEVTILFADVVGFTPLSLEMSPSEMVGLLNQVFSYFDALVSRYEAEKIRTIGDNYMVIAGAPRPCPDHARRMARMALEMLAFIDSPSNPAGRRLRFRIGINTGPVVAGVIGRTKFHYDVWGDAVNTASRMESHGEPGRVQIGRATYELIKDEFICLPRGTIQIKGKGDLETWFLTAERSPIVER